MPLEGDAGRSAMGPGRQQHAAAHVELANADAHFALTPQQRFSVQQNAHAGPVGHRHQRWHRRFDVGHVKQASDIAARPGGPSAISQPAYPGRAPADRARGTHAQEAVAEREAGFNGALGQHVVAFVAEDPVRVLRRLQRLKHLAVSPRQCGALIRRRVHPDRSPPDARHGAEAHRHSPCARRRSQGRSSR